MAKKNLKSNDGSAIITAVIVGMVVMVFCLLMLLSSYSLFVSAQEEDVSLAEREMIYSARDAANDKLLDFAMEKLASGKWSASDADDTFLKMDGIKKTGYDITASMHLDDEKILSISYNLYRDDELVYKITDKYQNDNNSWVRYQHE